MIPKIRHGKGFYRLCNRYACDSDTVLAAAGYTRNDVETNTFPLRNELSTALWKALSEAVEVMRPELTSAAQPGGERAGRTLEATRLGVSAGGQQVIQADQDAPSAGTGQPDEPVLHGELIPPLSFLTKANDEIRSALGRMSGAVFSIGRCLAEVKHFLPHGKFLNWIDGECCLSKREAQRYLRVWEEFGAKSAMLAHLGVTTLDQLACRAVPPLVREQIFEEMADGHNRLDDRAVQRRLKDARVSRSPAEPRNATVKAGGAEVSSRLYRILSEKLSPGEQQTFAELIARADLKALIDLLLNLGTSRRSSANVDA